jgi:hypothetical protein
VPAHHDLPPVTRISGKDIPSHTLRRGRKPERQTNHRTENKDHAAAVAAKLRSQISCSTDPARLEKMAREVETKRRQC